MEPSGASAHRRRLAGRKFPSAPFTPAQKELLPRRPRFFSTPTPRFEWPADSQQADARSHGTCKALETHCAILADGRIVACCLDYQGDLEIGHVLKGGVAQALNSPRAQAMRAGFSRNELVEPFCQRCQFCKRFG